MIKITPSTDALETKQNARICASSNDLADLLCDALSEMTAHAKDLELKLKEMTAYADKLAAGFPDGMLPKDVEVLREANAAFAEENHRLVSTVQFLQGANEALTEDNDRFVSECARLQAEIDRLLVELEDESI